MSFPSVILFDRPFDTHAAQWNFAVSQTGIDTSWILALDADYQVTEALASEIKNLQPDKDVSGFRARFVYCVEGVPIRSGIYPPVTVLYRRTCGEYVQDGHTQRLLLKGRIEDLTHPIWHDDRKPLGEWLRSQERYARLEAEKLREARFRDLGWKDRLRLLMIAAPVLVFGYCLFVRGGILDGRRGLLYATQRALFETLLGLYLLSSALKQRS
jgi:hypothetical protein